MKTFQTLRMVVVTMIAFSCQLVHGKTLKIAALVPEGTTWANGLNKISSTIQKETEGRVKLKLYLGGVAGDEPDVQRKIKIGQLQGGVFTGKALGDIFGDVRLMEVPFSFNEDRSRALSVLQGMTPHFNGGLEKAGYINLGFFEVGKVFIVSTKKVDNLNAMKGIKIWAWEGDQLGEAMLQSLQLVSVPLALPDVLTSLSTGIVDAAYASPIAVLALQWQSKIKYLIDVPVVYSFGAFLLDSKTWNKIKPLDQKVLKDVASKFIASANNTTVVENQSSLKSLRKNHNVKFITFPKKDLQAGVKVRNQVLTKLTGNLFSAPGVALFNTQLKKKLP